MIRNFTKAVVISLFAHVVFLSFLIYYNIRGEEPLGSEFVSVEIIGDRESISEEVGKNTLPPLSVGRFSRGPLGGPKENKKDLEPISEEVGKNTLPPLSVGRFSGGPLGESNDGNASPGSSTGNPTLSKIRNKIERSKYYPQQARLQRLEGRPEVSFRIAPNGTIESVSLAKSSGNALLDSAAIETVNRSAPLPYYDGQITLAINFTLR